jgi:phage/plasmid-like protein (TIGR03299 family)
MSHEVESMFSVKVTPWHGLGTILPNAPSIGDAIKYAGLDWEVGLKPLVTTDGDEVDHRATYRMSDGSILGVVGPTYQPLQNAEAFAFFEPFLEAGEATLETAGSLRKGKRVWILAQLNLEPSVIRKDDIVRKYVLLSNSHDGTMAVRVGYTPIRVVCANTLQLAHSESSKSALIRVQHRKNVDETLAAVRDIMNNANAQFEATAEQFRMLASKEINEEDLLRYVNLVFAPGRVARHAAKQAGAIVLASRVHEGELLDKEEALKSRVMERVRDLFENGRGHELAGKNYWGAYNAMTEYIGYERGADDQRLDQAWFGAGAALNRRALDVGIQMAQAA